MFLATLGVHGYKVTAGGTPAGPATLAAPGT